MLEWEPCPSRGWASRSLVEQPRRTGKKCFCSQKSWGVNMLQLCSVSNTRLTDNTFRNPFEPFQIKWDVYFSKELCLLVFIVLNMFLHMSMHHNVKIQETKYFLEIYWLRRTSSSQTYLRVPLCQCVYKKRGALDMTLNCIRRWGSSSGNLRSVLYTFILGLHWPGVVVNLIVRSIDQKDLFKNNSYGKKKLLESNYTKNVNRNGQWTRFSNF